MAKKRIMFMLSCMELSKKTISADSNGGRLLLYGNNSCTNQIPVIIDNRKPSYSVLHQHFKGCMKKIL
jgi:hypothetical protein